MAVAIAPESFHSIDLSVDGMGYTIQLWRGGAYQWRVLSVDVEGIGKSERPMPDQLSCQAALESAEQMARDLIESRAALAEVRPGRVLRFR
ncbi:hypothetical protein [Stenotrophomonas sp.]|uniref:hypothetical protein n=1 Tax=Stenotrophomonas sp. TaxID=69392 RepID=UPI0028A221E3|nr:hypothetical protein [Stenotrophomonas sp.]